MTIHAAIAVSYRLCMSLLPLFPALVAAQEVHLREVVSVGEKGDSFFRDISDIVVLEDGKFVVSDSKGFSLSKFDRDGSLLKRIGRSGNGPGEFRGGPDELALVRDTIVVVDKTHGVTYMHFFTTELDYVYSRVISKLPHDVAVDPYGQIYISAFSVVQDDYLFVYSRPFGKLRTIRLANLSPYPIANTFWISIDDSGSLILVFEFQNRIEIHDKTGRLKKWFSVRGLPQIAKFWEDRRIKSLMKGTKSLSERALLGASFLPDKLMFRGAGIDNRGHIFVQNGDYSELGRSYVFVVNYEGALVTGFVLPEGEKLMRLDDNGFLYTRDRERAVLRKYKLEYAGF